MREAQRGVWYDYKGWIVATSDDAFAVAPRRNAQVDFWVPHRYWYTINYVDVGDDTTVHVGRQIDMIELDPWLADKKGLVAHDDEENQS